MITFILFLWMIPIAANVYADRNGRKPNYLQMFVIRGMAAICHAVLLDVAVGYFPENLWAYSALDMLGMWAPVLLFQMTSFWLVFELALNIVRGREWLYFDRKEHDSGWVDKFFDALGNGAHLAAKIAALVVCVLSIIVIYHKA